MILNTRRRLAISNQRYNGNVNIARIGWPSIVRTAVGNSAEHIVDTFTLTLPTNCVLADGTHELKYSKTEIEYNPPRIRYIPRMTPGRADD